MAQVDGVSSMTLEDKKFDTSEKATTQSSTVETHDSYPARSSYGPGLLDEFAGMDEDCLLGEATVVKEAKQQDAIVEPPALPQKSSLRASRILDSLKLSSIESATQSLTTPHDAYMSSEEDASSSADEFSEEDFDSCSEASASSPSPRKSYEVTARVVSFIYSGKPLLVDLPSPRRSITSSTADTCSESGASIKTPSESSLSLDSHPPRTSSLASSGQPSFLKEDPFAETQDTSEVAKEDKSDAVVRLSKGPAVLNRVQRTFSLVRKRSRPFLRAPNGEAVSSEDVTIPPLPLSTINLPLASPAPETPVLESPSECTELSRSPVRYSDIIKSARKNASSKKSAAAAMPPPTTPLTPVTPKKGLLSGLKSSRRRSSKA